MTASLRIAGGGMLGFAVAFLVTFSVNTGIELAQLLRVGDS